MTSVAKDADAVAPPADATASPATDVDMDKEAKMLMHDERSCIFETRIERADLCRQRGSAQFKAGDIDKAVTWYQRALYHVDFDEGTWHFEFTAKNRSDVNVVRLPVYLNLAACYLVQGAPKGKENDDELLSKVIENTNLALAIDPENDKALYRAGRALLLTGDLAGAKEKLTKAAKHHPSDRNIRDALSTLKEKVAEHKKEEKERWGGRLLDEKATEASKPATKQQLKKPSESSNTLWWVAVVLIGVALALGQLSFVE
ncbi:hypothetical protein F441_12027 [Phytophthora nicotianae CJ01A1]|uniref:Uncharacterized protein n=6 Tax=Phytophthora nicotianae TaxID=4792 RepID=W2Q274_PHYN3|nr:hypothetical protein PPTG_13706 [Phytophthora nicotianae INRA-310]ETI42894.1 hypothetical protein F443_12061 [Phytophthora nicotianae P1569]ETK82930.1 hypothetical protein L915_11774 [Phytophthora nicotianae]ETO71527.1 hypothetical protein F444_12157 [Phytophthora nicotianae P1976]ETP12669.1 hypothetical protein F441_12027 [Phytophthora nicotianae CJ01A1]ETP40743.1 hypothetical protein F442_11972 [Phytophthora nicotianae P10297]